MLDFITSQTSDGLHLPDGTILRNLESQVLKNKEDIAAHYNRDRVLADFGIRVIGQVSTAEELPDPENYSGKFGDAYAVGVQPPYAFYIWTRADIDAGHPNDYWFDIGPLAIVGPQGPQGIPGPVGPEGLGSQWYISIYAPTGVRENDCWLQPVTGSIYDYKNGQWKIRGYLKGPQGPQGPVGPVGPVGPEGPQGEVGPRGLPSPIYKVEHVYDSVDFLPPPAVIPPEGNSAFLIKNGTTYDIYVVYEGRWLNLGPVGGQGLIAGQNVFAAYDQFGNSIGATLYHVSVICRNFSYDPTNGLNNGCLTLNIPNTYTFSGRGSLYNWLLSHGYTNAARSFYPASGFSFDANRKYTYIGVAANPDVYGALLFIGFREDRVSGGELRQASFGYHETDSTKTNYIPQIYYDASMIPPSGTL